MARYDLSDEEWRLVEPLLPKPGKGRHRVDDRRVANGMFCVLRTGAPWRDLPGRYAVCKRFNRWARRGIWLKVFEELAQRSPRSLQLIDRPIVRAHQHAEGGQRGARLTPSAVLVAD